MENKHPSLDYLPLFNFVFKWCIYNIFKKIKMNLIWSRICEHSQLNSSCKLLFYLCSPQKQLGVSSSSVVHKQQQQKKHEASTNRPAKQVPRSSSALWEPIRNDLPRHISRFNETKQRFFDLPAVCSYCYCRRGCSFSHPPPPPKAVLAGSIMFTAQLQFDSYFYLFYLFFSSANNGKGEVICSDLASNEEGEAANVVARR